MSFDILSRWSSAVLFHSETANTIAKAAAEAAKSGANLKGATLKGAKLEGYLFQILGSRHAVLVYATKVVIGCQSHDIEHWLDAYTAIGAKHGYTPAQIEEYGEYLEFAAKRISGKLRAA